MLPRRRIRRPPSSQSGSAPTPVVALAGNPNAGKTSLFNALTGQRQHVGNYPGVTVDKISAQVTVDDRSLELVDLPGTYSLSAYSIEEIVTRDFVLTEQPDVVVDVIDSTNLERNLYLLLQFQELGVPVVGALNMSDEAQQKGIRIDAPLLSRLLGIPLVCTVASRGVGIRKLLRTVVDVIDGRVDSVERHLNYGPELEYQHEKIAQALRTDTEFAQSHSVHWVAIRLLEGDPDARMKVEKAHASAGLVLGVAEEARRWTERHFGRDPEVVVGEQRYAYVRGACREAVQTLPKDTRRPDTTDLIDSVVLNRFLGVPIFFLIMLAIYTLTFRIGSPLSQWIQHLFALAGGAVGPLIPSALLRDFLVDGVLGGVGGVLGFFPLALMLFLGLSFLEDVGYMARAAFVMDKFLHLFGLHGRSFFPLMISTGCAVPGVMSARTLASPRDRILTILVSPLMMCGAKTPVIAMLCAAFFAHHAVLVFWSIWLFGWATAFFVGMVFRKTIFRGEDSPFVMELPPYRLPTPLGVLSHMWQKSASYVRKAGTFILAASVVIWASLSFPRVSPVPGDAAVATPSSSSTPYLAAQATHPEVPHPAALRPAEADSPHARQALESYAGQLGHALVPASRLAGFDWKINVALLSGIAAKEVIISTLGILYGFDQVAPPIVDESARVQQPTLTDRIRTDPAYSPASALALMVFIMIYLPCIATLAVATKEMGSIRWSLFLAGYTLILAFVLSVAVFQTGRLFA